MIKKFRTKYNPREVSKKFEKPSLVDPQYKDECTVEGIINRYGVLPDPKVIPVGADVSDYGDFADCMNRVNDALAKFDSMPAAIRARFGNDPKSFYAFVLDPENTEECVKLGLREVIEPEKDAVEVLEEIREKIVTPSPAQQAS